MKIKLAIFFLILAGALQAQSIRKDSILIEALSIDTLTTELVDYIQTEFKQKSDSIQQELQDGLGKIETVKASVQSKIDSLSKLGLPTEESCQP